MRASDARPMPDCQSAAAVDVHGQSHAIPSQLLHSVKKQTGYAIYGVHVSVTIVTIYIWCKVVSGHWNMMNPSLKMSHECDIFNRGLSYFNVAWTTVLHMFCRMANHQSAKQLIVGRTTSQLVDMPNRQQVSSRDLSLSPPVTSPPHTHSIPCTFLHFHRRPHPIPMHQLWLGADNVCILNFTNAMYPLQKPMHAFFCRNTCI